ncbi:MAG TPA: hypothetical protein VFW47_05710 [Phenylobacterium sp.]|nr:hypothetical protein [Phenylobacterium sp.]
MWPPERKNDALPTTPSVPGLRRGGITAIDDLKACQSALEKEVAERAAAGIGARGERSDPYPFVVDLRGVDQFRTLAGLLSARGHPARVADKVLGLIVRYAERV